ncbi:uracil-DNA glycosylase, partial [Variovorax sp. CT11-76]
MNAAVQTLRLDARQRAMLDEMGVKVWWPVPEAAEVPVAVAPAPVVEDEAEPIDMPPPNARYDARDDAVPEPEPVAPRAPAAAR